jgi:hypothetical protein
MKRVQLDTNNVIREIVQRCWSDESFKTQFINSPSDAIEVVTGSPYILPQGKTLVVNDQTDESKVYFNIPAKPNLTDLNIELDDSQLESISGGVIPPQWWIAIGMSLAATFHSGFQAGAAAATK